MSLEQEVNAQLAAGHKATFFDKSEIDPLKATVDNLEKVMQNLKVEVIEGADHGSALTSAKFVDGIKAFVESHSTMPVAGAK